MMAFRQPELSRANILCSCRLFWTSRCQNVNASLCLCAMCADLNEFDHLCRPRSHQVQGWSATRPRLAVRSCFYLFAKARSSSMTNRQARSVFTRTLWRTRSRSIVVLVVSASQDEIADADDGGFNGDDGEHNDDDPHFTTPPPEVRRWRIRRSPGAWRTPGLLPWPSRGLVPRRERPF